MYTVDYWSIHYQPVQLSDLIFSILLIISFLFLFFKQQFKCFFLKELHFLGISDVVTVLAGGLTVIVGCG